MRIFKAPDRQENWISFGTFFLYMIRKIQKFQIIWKVLKYDKIFPKHFLALWMTLKKQKFLICLWYWLWYCAKFKKKNFTFECETRSFRMWCFWHKSKSLVTKKNKIIGRVNDCLDNVFYAYTVQNCHNIWPTNSTYLINDIVLLIPRYALFFIWFWFWLCV